MEAMHHSEYESTVKRIFAEWAIECNIPRIHVSHLLKRLHTEAKMTFLPKDSRTLLMSRREKIVPTTVQPGKYQHMDIAASLLDSVAKMDASGRDLPNILRLLVNVDGIPLTNSSASEFWPILVKVLGETYTFFLGLLVR